MSKVKRDLERYEREKAFKIKIGKTKKLVEADQQTITGEYVIDSHKDCKVCQASLSYRKCDAFQRSGDCQLMPKQPEKKVLGYGEF